MGLAPVKLFLRKGHKVLIADLNEQAGNSLLQELEGDGYSDVYFCKCNVAKSDKVKKLYEFALEALGGIDSIINNAGIFKSGMLHEISEEDWQNIFDVDVKSIYLTSKYFVPDRSLKVELFLKLSQYTV